MSICSLTLGKVSKLPSISFKYLLSTYYVLGPMIGLGATPALMGMAFKGER